jgi:YNFM family putative membrane transporter
VLPPLAAAGFASMVSIRMTDPMLPALARDFDVAVATAAAVITVFTLAYGVMTLVWGPLGDALGKLRLVGWAALAATLASLACAVAPSLPMLVAARLVSGACCAAIIPLSIAFVGDTVTYEQRQATLARLATGTLTGMVAGQVLGGVAADTVGWRAGFVLVAVVFAAAGLAVMRLRARLELSGGPAPAHRDPGALLAGYATILHSRWAALVLLTALLEGVLVFAALAFIPTWLHETTGLTLAAAGGVVAAVGVGGLLYVLTADRWIARLGPPGLARLAGLLLAAGFGALVAAGGLAPGPSTWALMALATATVGAGFYMLHNTLQTLATQLAPQARATSVGLFAVAIFFGQSIGVGIMALIGPVLGYGGPIIACGLLLGLLGVGLGAALAHRGS